MCGLTNVLRRALGIRPYVWTPTRPLHDPSAPNGQRCLNGAASWVAYGLTPQEAQRLAEVERAHRQIRQIAADLEARRREHE